MKSERENMNNTFSFVAGVTVHNVIAALIIMGKEKDRTVALRFITLLDSKFAAPDFIINDRQVAEVKSESNKNTRGVLSESESASTQFR